MSSCEGQDRSSKKKKKIKEKERKISVAECLFCSLSYGAAVLIVCVFGCWETGLFLFNKIGKT